MSGALYQYSSGDKYETSNLYVLTASGCFDSAYVEIVTPPADEDSSERITTATINGVDNECNENEKLLEKDGKIKITKASEDWNLPDFSSLPSKDKINEQQRDDNGGELIRLIQQTDPEVLKKILLAHASDHRAALLSYVEGISFLTMIQMH